MNKEWSLHFKITNWCNLNCAHCCERSNSTQPLNLLSLEKMERYLYESAHMPIKPNELISIGGGEGITPYLHNLPDYIPNALDIIYKYDFVPTIKTNGLWGDNKKIRKKILSDIADCAYKSQKLVTLDISVDEFHNNKNSIIKIINDILNNERLSFAIRICLVGFNTKKSANALFNLKQELSNKGFYVQNVPNGVWVDWIISSPNGKMLYVFNDFSNDIYDLGRASENRVYTTKIKPYKNNYSYCLQIDNNDTAMLNYMYREPINNRDLSKVLYSLINRAEGR